MAHALQLVCGSTVVDLSAGNYQIARYVPKYEGKDFVTETARIQVKGSDIADLQGNLAAIKQMFARARRFQDNEMGNRVWLQFQPNGYTVEYESEISDGRVVEPDSTLMSDWANIEVEVQVIWTRRDWWETVAVVDLDSTNVNGTTLYLPVGVVHDQANVGGVVRVINATFTTTGDLPAPIQIEYTESPDDSTINLKGLIVGLNSSYPTFTLPAIEADNGTGGTKIPGSSDTALYSSGYARSLTLTTSLAKLLEITVDDAYSTLFNGASIMLSGAFPAGAGTDVQLQIRLSTSGTTIYTGPVVNLTADVVQILDTVNFPRIDDPVTVSNDIIIEIWGRRTTTATALVMDCIYLFPMDGYRILRMMGSATLDHGEYFIDNQINGQTYAAVGSGAYANWILSGRGELMAEPGKAQQIFVLPIQATYTPNAFYKVAVRYKPRRCTL